MDTTRVDICYRPLRIGWAIRAGDFDAFRAALRMSFAFWGGRFNPVIVVDQEEQARNLVDLFRVDMIVPVGESDVVKSFPNRFPYLLNPFIPRELFIEGFEDWHSQVLDIHNALVHLQGKPEWQAAKKNALRIYSWASDDPLSDVFLTQFGQYPNPDEIHIDYCDLLIRGADAARVEIESTSKLPEDLLDFPSISFLSRFGLKRHYGVPAGWDYPGFFSGNATNLDDLVCCWNLRAADIPLWFVDAKHLERYGSTIEFWGKEMRDMVQGLHEFDRHVAVWVRDESVDREKLRESMADILKPFGENEFTFCTVGPGSFNGLNVRAPMMHFGQVPTLGVVGTEFGKPKISFPLDNKPFCSDNWFHTQHLVASLSFIGALYGDEQHTFVPPYVPELNEFYGRSQHLYDKIRSEPGRIGLVIDAADPTSSLNATSVPDLFEKIFEMAGFKSKLSAGGLIARQLIAQLGGVDGARAFKIPGVRRLLKTYSPTDTFSKHGALQLIGGKDPENPDANFADYEDRLYIEPRPPGVKLTPEAVFTHLVGRGLFRIGVELKCPHCRMDSWTALDVLKQKHVCDLCGHEFDATRQLVASTWHYRRSGLLGAERNAQGAVPVLLTLQQFAVNLKGFWHDAIYSASLDLESEALGDPPQCEIDFLWLIPRNYPDRVVVILGECKDRGGKKDGAKDTGTIDEKDIDHLRRVADALPRKRFDTFIVLAKLCPFTADEIGLAKTLNEEYRRRVILLTARELEPYHFYERTKQKYEGIKEYASTPEDLANNTAQMYFKPEETKAPIADVNWSPD